MNCVINSRPSNKIAISYRPGWGSRIESIGTATSILTNRSENSKESSLVPAPRHSANHPIRPPKPEHISPLDERIYVERLRPTSSHFFANVSEVILSDRTIIGLFGPYLFPDSPFARTLLSNSIVFGKRPLSAANVRAAGCEHGVIGPEQATVP